MITASGPAWPPREGAKCSPAVGPKDGNGWRPGLVGRNSLPRSLSLKSRTEIDRLFECGQRFPAVFFTLIWEPAEDFKYGVFVGRKFGHAPGRNRIKRLLREAIRLSRPALERTGRVALLPKGTKEEPELERLVADVTHIFKQINAG